MYQKDIKDNNKHKIAKFTTSALGMGAFRLVAQAGQTYTAVVKSGDRAVEAFPLPSAKKKTLYYR